MDKLRSKRVIYNVISSLLLEVISIICGFVLPKLILTTFGSTYNGITTSITQFLSYITLLRAGVGGVTRAALYKPLAKSDTEAISGIIKATEIFMRKIAYIFIVILIVFALIYPCIVKNEFDYFFTFTLILIMGITTFIQYYFGITYQILIGADQKQYISSIIQSVTLIMNLIVAIIIIKLGYGIRSFKLGSTIVFSLNPIILYLYVKNKYKIIKDIKPNNIAIKQRWDAFMHQIAMFVQTNADIVILTIFSNLKEVSVYSIYYLVLNGVKKLLETFTTGIEAAFGNMIALNEYTMLKKATKNLEIILYSLGAVSYACVINLIIPFIKIYTNGITDVSYNRPIFALILGLSQFFYCIRTPYQYIVEAAGHFKQTRNGAILEAILNLIISIVFVINYGLIGVAIGTACSIIFRTIQYIIYVSKYILKRSLIEAVNKVLISLMNMLIITVIAQFILLKPLNNYLELVIAGIYLGFISIIIVIISNLIFNLKASKECFILIRKMLNI